MPKELIFEKNEHGDPNTQGTVIRVGWSRESGHVELATIRDDSQVLEPGVEANGWFAQMDRQSINRLIRVLRNARDSAFGKDA
jgi:hypothetical protein